MDIQVHCGCPCPLCTSVSTMDIYVHYGHLCPPWTSMSAMDIYVRAHIFMSRHIVNVSGCLINAQERYQQSIYCSVQSESSLGLFLGFVHILYGPDIIVWAWTSMSTMDIQVHSGCLCPIWMSMSMVDVHVHSRCPCPQQMSMSTMDMDVRLSESRDLSQVKFLTCLKPLF